METRFGLGWLNRVAVVTASGGSGVVLADRCEELGLALPPLSDEPGRKALPHLASLEFPTQSILIFVSCNVAQHRSLLARPEVPTMPTAIYRLISQPGAANYGQAMAMSTLLLVLCGFGIAIIERDSKAIA